MIRASEPLPVIYAHINRRSQKSHCVCMKHTYSKIKISNMKKYLEAIVLFLLLGIKHTRCKLFLSNRRRRGNVPLKERQASIQGWWWESKATAAAAEEEEESQPQIHKSNKFLSYSNKQSIAGNEGGGVSSSSSSSSVTEGTNGRILRPTGEEKYSHQTQHDSSNGSTRQPRRLGRHERDLQDVKENNSNNQELTKTNFSDASTRQKLCTVNANGSFGSSAGIRVSIFFFYQVEAVAGTTETQMNTVVLQDTETTLSDILLSRVLDECRGSTSTTTLAQTETESAAREDQEALSSSSGGKYVGLSSRPADFVFRGFECSEEATQPCFVVSGSMTVYVVDLDPGAVQEQMRFEIFLVMSSGEIPATVSLVSSVLLLDDSLNVATLPIMEMEPPTTQPTTSLPTTTIVSPTTSPSLLPAKTEEPTVQITTVAPSVPPTTEVPSASPTTTKPTLSPTVTPSISTDFPTFAPSMSPTMAAPTTMEPSSPVPAVPTTDIQTETPTVEYATAADSPTQAVAKETLAIVDPTDDPQINLPSNATATTQEPTTSQPNIATAEPIYYKYPPYHESAFERVPVWGWVLLGLAICVCCTYADPDDDDDDPGVNRNLRATHERHNLNNTDEIEKEKDNHNDSEVFSSGEYFRKLYRQ